MKLVRCEEKSLTRCISMKCEFQTTDGAPEQFVLLRFDIAPFYYVINKCQMRINDKLEKCVHSVVFNMSKFIPNKERSRTALIFCFHLKKTAPESYRSLREAYGEHALWQDMCERWIWRFKSGDFEVTDKEHIKSGKKIRRCGITSIVGRRWFANTKTTRLAIGR